MTLCLLLGNTNVSLYEYILYCFNYFCEVHKFKKEIMPHVIPKAEETNTVPRSPYTQMVRLERRAMATSMAHCKRGPHCRGKASERGLALT